jgi:hypothetical protein
LSETQDNVVVGPADFGKTAEVFKTAILNMRQEADGLSAFARKAGQIRRNQPVFDSVAPILSIKRSILRIAVVIQHTSDIAVSVSRWGQETRGNKTRRVVK